MDVPTPTFLLSVCGVPLKPTLVTALRLAPVPNPRYPTVGNLLWCIARYPGRIPRRLIRVRLRVRVRVGVLSLDLPSWASADKSGISNNLNQWIGLFNQPEPVNHMFLTTWTSESHVSNNLNQWIGLFNQPEPVNHVFVTTWTVPTEP